MGDYNINLLNSGSHKPTNDFENLMSSNGLYPLISKPTRITSSSATLTYIDNIFTSNREYNMVCGILYTDISDHLPLYQMTNLKLTTYPPPPQVELTRIINPFHINSFRSKLADVDWSFLDSSDSPNDCYNIIQNHLQTLYKECFPLIPVHSGVRRDSKPCFSSGLSNSCMRKNSLHKQYITNPTPNNKSKIASIVTNIITW